jgi:hypothetical protein
MGVWAAPVGPSQLSTPTDRLEEGGGQSRIHVFTGCLHGEVLAQDAGLGRPEHNASDSG